MPAEVPTKNTTSVFVQSEVSVQTDEGKEVKAEAKAE
jgi:hypothetical protein